jgi:hypothetical protein
MSQITESIFDGETHVVPLAEVMFIQKYKRMTAGHPFPDIEPRIGVFLKSSDSPLPTLHLYGDEMEAFTRDWCRYRYELEKATLAPVIELACEPSTHSLEDDFDHFVAYMGYGDLPPYTLNAIKTGYEHGSARTSPAPWSTHGALDVLAERGRQVEREHCDSARDDQYKNYELVHAAVAYAGWTEAYPLEGHPPPQWPSSWSPKHWKPKDRRRDLVRAAALLIAEIDRIDRSPETKSGNQSPEALPIQDFTGSMG